MLDKLQALADRYDKLSELLCDPDVASDNKSCVNIPKSNPICSQRTKHTMSTNR